MKEKDLWEIFTETKGCKKNKEDCSFAKCHSWAECDSLVTAILSAGYIKKSEIECDEEKLRNFIGDLMVKDDLSFQITGGHPQDMLMYVAHTIATNLKSIIK